MLRTLKKLFKNKGFVALPIIIIGAVLAFSVLGGLAYKYKDKLDIFDVDKNNMLAQTGGVFAAYPNFSLTPTTEYVDQIDSYINQAKTLYNQNVVSGQLSTNSEILNLLEQAKTVTSQLLDM